MKKLMRFAAEEYKKLLLQLKFKVLLVLSVLFPIGVGLAINYMNRGTGVEIVNPGRFPIFVLELLTGIVLPVLAIFLVGELLAGEFKDGTMKNIFALPVSKSIIYLGKLLAGAALAGTCLLALGLVGTIMAVGIYGLTALSGLGGALAAYLGAFLVLVLLMTLAGMLALFTGGPSMAILLNLAVWFGLGIVGLFFPAVKEFLPTSFTGWYQPLVNGVNLSMALPPLLYMLCYCVVFTAGGLLIFEKKEV